MKKKKEVEDDDLVYLILQLTSVLANDINADNKYYWYYINQSNSTAGAMKESMAKPKAHLIRQRAKKNAAMKRTHGARSLRTTSRDTAEF